MRFWQSCDDGGCDVIAFLGLTFTISLAAFLCIYAVPAARSPETLKGFPFWLVMVWGPSIAAIVLSGRDGELTTLLARSVQVSPVPGSVWVLVAAPLALLLVLRPFAPGTPLAIGPGVLAAMVLFNLILGPLGEELGWRGVLQHGLMADAGWLEASLLVGMIWFVWHLPLWLIESPHAQIALHLFGIHVMLYSVIIGAAYTMSGGSILPAILIHLTVNLASNLAVFAGFSKANDWFAAAIVPYLVLAVIAIGLVVHRSGHWGLRWLDAPPLV